MKECQSQSPRHSHHHPGSAAKTWFALALLWCVAGLGTGHAQTRYECENGVRANVGTTADANASNGLRASKSSQGGAGSVTMTVNVPTKGMYNMVMCTYFMGRQTFIAVNGVDISSSPVTSSGSDANGYGHNIVPVALYAGSNTIVLYNNIDWGPHWDYIEIPAAPTGDFFTVAASASAGGSISPVGNIPVLPNGNQTFAITRNYGYVADVVVDGVSQGDIPSYTFSSVSADHTIAANFSAAPTHTVSGHVTAAPGGGATVSVKALATGLPIQTTTTDASGNYSFAAVPAGTSFLCASQTGYMISADQAVPVSADTTGVDFTLTAGRNIPQMENLLFAADSNSLGSLGSAGNWPLLYSTYPQISTLTAVNSPTVAKLRGIKYDYNLRADGDGYRLNTVPDTAPIPTRGATIVTLVKPVRNATNDSFNPIVSIYYGNLNLCVKNDSGIVRVRRNNSDYNSTTAIPDGQLTLLSMIVQPDGTFTVWASAWSETAKAFGTPGVVLTTSNTSTFTAFTPATGGTDNYRKNIMVGRNDNSTNYTFNGYIGDTFVYKTALSTAERATLEADISTKLTSLPTYDITASAGTGGSIVPDGVTAVGETDSLTYTITPAWGYDIASVLIDGTTDAGPVASYTFANVAATHTIAATFTAKPAVIVSGSVFVGDIPTDSATVSVYTDAACTNLVTTTATNPGGGYAISAPQNATVYLKATKGAFAPSASLAVAVGTVELLDQNLNITSRRYEAEDAVYSGCAINTDVNASGGKRVAALQYGGNNTVTFSIHAQTSGDNSMVMGYYQPWDGNRDTFITVNGTALPNIPAVNVASPNYGKTTSTIPLTAGINTVVLSNGNAWGPHWDYLDIPQPVYVVVASAGANGSISQSGRTFVAPGASQTYTISADPGYAVAQVLVDGVNQPAAAASGSYTFSNVAGDHTIAASFAVPPADPYTGWLNNPPHWNLTGNAAAKTADPDGDSMTNFQEFAFGLNPVNGSSCNPMVSPLDRKTRTFSYTRGAATGLTYTVWISTDLKNWSAVAADQAVGAPLDGVSPVTVTLPDPLPAGNTVFVRVQAE